jgi:hypothetical protein
MADKAREGLPVIDVAGLKFTKLFTLPLLIDNEVGV